MSNFYPFTNKRAKTTIVHLSTCFEKRTHADNDQPEKKLKPGGGCWVHDSCHVCWIPFSGCREEVENVWANQRLGRLSCFFHQPKKTTNLVENVKILLPIKFHRIPFSGSREEVENVWANQRPELPSWFSDPPEKQKMVKDLETLLHVKFHSIQFSSCRSRKCVMLTTMDS